MLFIKTKYNTRIFVVILFVVFCPNKQRYSEHSVCLEQSLFQIFKKKINTKTQKKRVLPFVVGGGGAFCYYNYYY